jgi:hypothetical protein
MNSSINNLMMIIITVYPNDKIKKEKEKENNVREMFFF